MSHECTHPSVVKNGIDEGVRRTFLCPFSARQLRGLSAGTGVTILLLWSFRGGGGRMIRGQWGFSLLTPHFASHWPFLAWNAVQ